VKRLLNLFPIASLATSDAARSHSRAHAADVVVADVPVDLFRGLRQAERSQLGIFTPPVAVTLSPLPVTNRALGATRRRDTISLA
jgi:hypothetical protein